MPELPEVETARRIIDRELCGRTITAVHVSLSKILRESPLPSELVLVGKTLTQVRRRAKVLILDFDDDVSLMMHLKLAGQIAVFSPDGRRSIAGHPVPKPEGEFPHKATHARIDFDDGSMLYYSDIRQFGWWRILAREDVDAMLDAFGFGPEGTEILDSSTLGKVMQNRGIPIKTLLLDQTYIAGLGNIYVDEVLFRAKLHPATPSRDVSAGKRKQIFENIPLVLAEGIRQGGAKIVNSKAKPVDDFPSVHGREGEPCFVCGTTIQKTRVGSRGTYFCPKCQRAPRKAPVDK